MQIICGLAEIPPIIFHFLACLLSLSQAPRLPFLPNSLSLLMDGSLLYFQSAISPDVVRVSDAAAGRGRAREGGVAEQDEDGVMWRTRHLENKQMKMNAWAPRYSRQTARAAQTNNLSAASISYCVTCTRLHQCKPFVFQKIYFFLMSIKQNALNWSVDHSPPVSVQEEV